MTFSTLYEERPSGPSITMHDRAKTVASLVAVHRLITWTQAEFNEEEQRAAEKQLNRDLREATGLQWSLLTAMQYLTGQRADKALLRWADEFAQVGLTPRLTGAMVTLANDFCANGVDGKCLSSGLLVQAFKERPLDAAMLARTLVAPQGSAPG